MNKALRFKFNRIVAIVICLALAITAMSAVSFIGFGAKAKDSTEFVPEMVTISNNQFGDISGNAPETPNSWSGAYLAGENSSGSVIGGVMELDNYQQHYDAYKLSEDYPGEFKNTSPDSPFGDGNGETNRNVLMINNRTTTAYGYSSSDITFEANRFYMIKAWVRTGNFKDGEGASIRLTGLSEDVAFKDINTVKNLKKDASGFPVFEESGDGWSEYTFYIASSSYASSTVKISLQVGDYYKNETTGKSLYNPAHGYAFFDNIQATQISPASFYNKKAAPTSGDNILVKDLSDLSSYLDGTDNAYEKTNYNFTNELTDWSFVYPRESDLNDVKTGTYNGAIEFNKDSATSKKYNLTTNPSSSLGNFEKGDASSYIISSYNTDDLSYNQTAIGLSSDQTILIERYKFYRVSAWVNTFDVSGGSGAALVLHSEIDPADTENTKDLNATIANCVGDPSNKARGGFKQYSFYIKGSSFENHTANIELWLGTEGSESQGTALFDNITVTELTPAQFTANSASGTLVNIDTNTRKGGSPLRDAANLDGTGIANGNFYFISDYTDLIFPLPAKDWTGYDAASTGTIGYSTGKVDTDKIISGIVPTDEEHFKANYTSYGKGAINPNTAAGRMPNSPDYKSSMLMINSDIETAYCYRSPAFSVAGATEEAAAKPGKLSVKLSTQNISANGANLVLKSGGKVLATIEKINTNDKFKTYSFYIEPETAGASDLTVEIWLGLNDRTNNQTKLSSGRVFVESVSYQTTDETFSTLQNAYDKARRDNSSEILSATYSFVSENLNSYDYYDSSYVKHPYNWKLSSGVSTENIVYGIFDPKNGLGDPSQTIVPHTFKNTEDAANNGVLFLSNSIPTVSRLTLDRQYALEANLYYQVSVRMKVDIPSQESNKAVGASIKLTETDYSFKNIMSTSETHDLFVDNETFQTFTFYIKAGAEAKSIGIEISLGDATSSQRYCQGKVYVNDITFKSMTNVNFDELTTDEKLKENDKILKADFSVPTTADKEDTSPEKSTFDWLIIPAILFGVAILIAIVGFSARKIVARRANRKTYEAVLTYDRAATLNKDFNASVTKDEDKVANTIDPSETRDSVYDSFDETSTPIVKKLKDTETVISESEITIISNSEEKQETDSSDTSQEGNSDDKFNDGFDD